MADYYTKLSFVLACRPEDAERLDAAFLVDRETAALPDCIRASFPPTAEEPDDPLSGLAALYDGDEVDFMHIGAGIDHCEEGLHIYGEESPQIEVIAELIRRLAPSTLFFGFVWIGDCSKPRPDAYSGGFAAIRTEGVVYGSLHDELEKALGPS